jgi:predicted negative regulator of RcsB-dependent stress response
MDKRLKNVQQADLTESRVNDDFVYWLKTWGSNILIVILLIAAAGMGWQWWEQRREQERDSAWADLKEARLPVALLEVARQHGDKDSVALFAQLSAADAYMTSLSRGVRFDRDAAAEDSKITPELRAEWLQEADRLYAAVAEATAGSPALGKQLIHANALFGRAAVAEDRHDLATAERLLTEVQGAVKGAKSAMLAEIAQARLARIAELKTEVVFAPTSTLLATQPTQPAPVAPVAAAPSDPDKPIIRINPDTGLPLLPDDYPEGKLYYMENGDILQRSGKATIVLKRAPQGPDSPLQPAPDAPETLPPTAPPPPPAR